MLGKEDKLDPSDPTVDFFSLVRQAQTRLQRANELKEQRRIERKRRSLHSYKRNKRNRH